MGAMIRAMVISPQQLQHMDAQQLRALAEGLLVKVMDQDQQLAAHQQSLVSKDQEIHFKQTKIDLLTHEIARYKRLQFAAKSEKLHADQRSLLDETLDADLAALEAELHALSPAPAEQTDTADTPEAKPRRTALPAHLPRVEIQHEPESTACGCGCQMKRIGEDVSEKLDYTPGTFTVERHVRGKWACMACQKLVQAPVPAQIIDKGIPTSNLLANVLVAKYGDHLPLYRLEEIYAREGVPLPRSTLAQWVGQCGVQLQPLVDALKAEMLTHTVLHADETPVEMLKPGTGKTHRAYLWAYSPGVFEPMKTVVYDFAESRSGEHARAFLGEWRGSLICDDYGGYKANFAQGITEVGCMAHARRKFFDLHANGSSLIAGQALQTIGLLYDIERETQNLSAEDRQAIRQDKSRRIADALHGWLLAQRSQVANGGATAKALDYSLKRWQALTRFIDDGRLPIDNNWIENQMRPIAIGRKNWLFAGSLLAGQRAAAIMSLIQSAKLNGHDPHAYLRDVLRRLPTHKASQIGELLPHRWAPGQRRQNVSA
jgi:transposase